MTNLSIYLSIYLSKSLRLVVAYNERLSELIGYISGKQQRPSQARRKAKARREQKRKYLRFKDRGEKSVICFALCLVKFITSGLQNKDHSTFACCLAQKKFKKKTNLENCVRIYKIPKKFKYLYID